MGSVTKVKGVVATRPAICGAKTRGGGVCQNPPVEGRSRCRMHGGATPVKHGLYSKDLALNERLRDFVALVVESQAEDGDALTLQNEITLLRALFLSLFSSGEGPDPEDVAKIAQAIDRLRRSEEAAKALIPRSEAIQVFRMLIECVRRHVDESTFTKIYGDMDRAGLGGVRDL